MSSLSGKHSHSFDCAYFITRVLSLKHSVGRSYLANCLEAAEAPLRVFACELAAKHRFMSISLKERPICKALT